MIDYGFIVPYRKLSLKDCDEVIRQHINEDRTPKKKLRSDETSKYWVMLEELSDLPLPSRTKNFLESLEDQLGIKCFLTFEQAEKLQEIYKERTQ